MLLRKLSVLTGLAALGFSCWVSALGLGELTLHSALDEPFDAEIELVNIGEADENQILVGLASKSDFARAGVTWEFHLLNLKFKTDLSDADRPVVKISSKEPIKEPYLDFVAQLQWPSGLLLREYTLFLDLPVFDSNKAVSSTASAVTAKPAKQSASKSDTRVNQVPAGQTVAAGSTSSPASTMAGNDADYRVKSGDTLWHIASSADIGATTVQQRMVAIHAANPQAFTDGNANLLRKGAVIRMPDLASAESVNPVEARQLVNDQVKAWDEKNRQATVRELIGDVPVATQSKKADSKEGLLRLSTPTENEASYAQQLGRTTGSEGNSTTSDVLQNELSITREELDRSKRENLELKAKLEGLEAQLTTQSKLFELENDELKAVQMGVLADKTTEEADTSSRDEVADTATRGQTPGIVAIDETTDIATRNETEEVAEDTSEVASQLDDVGGVGAGTEIESADKSPLSGLFAFLQSNWIPLLGFIGVLLGVIFLVAKSKKEDQPEPIDPFLSPDADTTNIDQENLSAIELLADIEPLTASEPKGEEEPAVQQPVNLEVAEPEEIEEVDPIGEADIYQSLGNFTEAESVIEKAIEASPNDSKLHLKRLDLFASQHDIERFDAYYPALVAFGDASATATADRLRANIPEPEPEVAEEPGPLTLEQQVAEELGIAGLELDLSGTSDREDEPTDDLDSLLGDAPLSEELEAELESSFVDSKDDELDLSGIELDLESTTSSAETESEELDEDFEASMFGDISLPDELEELSAGLEGEKDASEDDLELPDLDIELEDTKLESKEDEGLELNLDSLDFDSDEGLELVAGADERNTQLELAQAYIEMGDEPGAKDILIEVANNGSEEQKQQADELLAKLG
jgi:pilus assembly protein FimV